MKINLSLYIEEDVVKRLDSYIERFKNTLPEVAQSGVSRSLIAEEIIKVFLAKEEVLYGKLSH
jgi:hypothetical protein